MSQEGGVLAADATESTALGSAIVSWIYTVIILVIAIVQSSKVSLDLFGNTYDGNYKLIQGGTVIVTYFCLLSVLAGDLMYLSANDKECATRWTLILNFQQFSKTMTYLVLLARVNKFYAHTRFAIRQNTLLKFGIVVVAIGMMCLFAIILFPIDPVIAQFDSSYPTWCVVSKGFNLFYVAGGIIIIQDIIAALSFIWLFNRRWQQIDEEIRKKQDDDEDANHILYYVSKIKALATTMLVLTVLLTLTTMITGLGVFAQTDLVIVPICLTLMTPYYPDIRYYSKICCLCHIICCGKGEPREAPIDGALLHKFAMKADGTRVHDDKGDDHDDQEMKQQDQEQTSTL